MVEIDEWFPNFEMFVMFMLPALIMVTIAVFLITFWINKKKTATKAPMDWMDIMKFGTAIYLVVPVWRIISYLRGDINNSELIQGLFVTDFINYMTLALLTGIMGLIFILKKKNDEWVGVKNDG